MSITPKRLPPAIRDLLDYLWNHLPAVPFDSVPEHLRGAIAWCVIQEPQSVRIRGIGDVPYVEILQPGISSLEGDRLLDAPST